MITWWGDCQGAHPTCGIAAHRARNIEPKTLNQPSDQPYDLTPRPSGSGVCWPEAPIHIPHYSDHRGANRKPPIGTQCSPPLHRTAETFDWVTHPDEAEGLGVAGRPFEVVQERPGEVPKGGREGEVQKEGRGAMAAPLLNTNVPLGAQSSPSTSLKVAPGVILQFWDTPLLDPHPHRFLNSPGFDVGGCVSGRVCMFDCPLHNTTPPREEGGGRCDPRSSPSG